MANKRLFEGQKKFSSGNVQLTHFYSSFQLPHLPEIMQVILFKAGKLTNLYLRLFSEHSDNAQDNLLF